ncbi:MAG: hypothetical protein H7836_08140 [Magnetococcus sp. YQC-3]
MNERLWCYKLVFSENTKESNNTGMQVGLNRYCQCMICRNPLGYLPDPPYTKDNICYNCYQVIRCNQEIKELIVEESKKSKYDPKPY